MAAMKLNPENLLMLLVILGSINTLKALDPSVFMQNVGRLIQQPLSTINENANRLLQTRNALNVRTSQINFPYGSLQSWNNILLPHTTNSPSIHKIYKPPSIGRPYNIPMGKNAPKEADSEISISLRKGFSKPKPKNLLQEYMNTLTELEKRFYNITFNVLSANSPEENHHNGISFVQSGLFLHLMLTALSAAVDQPTRRQIEQASRFPHSNEKKSKVLTAIVSWLPTSNPELKFRWSSRLLVPPDTALSPEFLDGPAKALLLKVHHLNKTDDPAYLADTFNKMIEEDSGGALHDTFDEDEFSSGFTGALISTLYLRAQWRSAPTLLNDTSAFNGSADARASRAIRINDVIGYASLDDWDAEAIELSYATPGLTLVLVVPRDNNLRGLSEHLADRGVGIVVKQMQRRRVAVTLPVYTLRMTLLLPNKLRAMGITGLESNGTRSETGSKLVLSHAVQRIMFWAEAGRNAYKDDGIEWEEHPEMELVVDRPYVFFVRWHNVTLMNGHFVL